MREILYQTESLLKRLHVIIIWFFENGTSRHVAPLVELCDWSFCRLEPQFDLVDQ